MCTAIIQEYQDEVIACPTTPQEWSAIADLFSQKWHFRHALGAMDGQHVTIRYPKRGGSQYYNYKGFHFIMLLGLVDVDHKFIWADVGSNGTASDAQIFTDSELKEAIENNVIGFPAAHPLPNDDRDTPYFIIGDDAFSLRMWMMKPYWMHGLSVPERIFNYQLSRARRIVENAFGILSNRFGRLLTTLRQQPPVVRDVILSCICLHNLMQICYPALQNAALDVENDQLNLIPGDWRNGVQMQDVQDIDCRNRAMRAAKQ